MRYFSSQLVLVLFCCWNSLFAQDISIHLALIDVRDDVDSLSPYLQITYINKGKINYYFPGVIPLDATIPVFSSPLKRIKEQDSINLKVFLQRQLFEKQLFYGERYYVQLELKPYQKWFLMPFVDDEDEVMEPAINMYLSAYYDMINNKCHKKKPLSFRRKRLRSDPSFIFLKPDEYISHIISLHDIMRTGIVLTVYLPNAKSIGMDNNLPKKIGCFSLYQGNIEGDNLLIDFSK